MDIKKNNKNDLIITADTIVVCDNKVLGKPNDYDCALNMLMSLSGRMRLMEIC